MISNGRIFASTITPWQWRPYTGSNKHAHHVHVSVMGDSRAFDLADPWKIDTDAPVATAPVPPKPAGITDAMRRRMMEAMMGYEGHATKPAVFVAPDGRPEISGITQKDHPQQYATLKNLLDRGMFDTAREEVLEYYDTYTDPAQNWTDRAGVEFFLRDCILNRGPTGAAEILQRAVGVEVDHQVGPTTRGALAALAPEVAIDKLRRAREEYEDAVYTRAAREAKGQWKGLLNRWNKAQAQAKAFQKEQGYTPAKSPEGAAGTAVIVVGTGAAVAVKQDPWTRTEMTMAGFSILVAAVVVFMIVRKMRSR